MNDHSRVGLYLRISHDSRKGTADEGAGVERQRADCMAVMAEHPDWTLVDTYTDNDVSASVEDAVRPEWDRLFADVRAGRVTRILAWARDRLSRDTVDAGLLERLARKHSVLITIHPGTTFDLREPAEAFQFQILGNVAGFEVAQKKKRTSARIGQDLEKGVPYMRYRWFGYLPNPDKIDRKNVNPYDGTVLHPEEAEAVRWLYRQVLDGNESLRALTRGLESQGIVPASGRGRWTAASIKLILQNPVYAGIQSRVDKVKVGTVVRRKRILLPEIETRWTPIVSRSDWYAVQELLKDRKAIVAKGVRGVRKTWLSNLASCSICGMGFTRSRDRLACSRSSDHAQGISLEVFRGIVEPFIVRRIAMIGSRLRETDPVATELAQLRASLASLDEDLEAVRGIERAALRVQEMNRVTAQQDEIQERIVKLSASRSLRTVVADLAPWREDGKVTFDRMSENLSMAQEGWESLSMEQKNKVAKMVGRYVVVPSNNKIFGRDRVLIYLRDPKTGEVAPAPLQDDHDEYATL